MTTKIYTIRGLNSLVLTLLFVSNSKEKLSPNQTEPLNLTASKKKAFNPSDAIESLTIYGPYTLNTTQICSISDPEIFTKQIFQEEMTPLTETIENTFEQGLIEKGLRTNQSEPIRKSFYLSLLRPKLILFSGTISLITLIISIFEFFCCGKCSCLFNVDREIITDKDNHEKIEIKISLTKRREKMEICLKGRKCKIFSWGLIFLLVFFILILSIIWVFNSFGAVQGVYEARCDTAKNFRKVEAGFYKSKDSQFLGLDGISKLNQQVINYFEKIDEIELEDLELISQKKFNEQLETIASNLELFKEKYLDFYVKSCKNDLEVFTDSSINFNQHVEYIKNQDLEMIKLQFGSLETGVNNLQDFKKTTSMSSIISNIFNSLAAKISIVKEGIEILKSRLPQDPTIEQWINFTNSYLTVCTVLLFGTIFFFFLTILIDSFAEHKEKKKMFRCFSFTTCLLLTASVNFNIFAVFSYSASNLGKNFCFYSEKVIENSEWSDIYFNRKLKSYVDICLFSHGKNFALFLNYDDKAIFNKMGNVFEGFSWDKYEIKLNNDENLPLNFQYYEEYLDKLETSSSLDFDYSIEESPSKALENINEIVKCTLDEFALQKENCKYQISQETDSADHRVEDEYCIALDVFPEFDPGKRYQNLGTCALPSVEKINYLIDCLKSQKELISKMRGEFSATISSNIKKLYSDLDDVKESVDKIKEAIGPLRTFFENPLHSFPQSINCSFTSDLLYQSAGSFCVNSVKTFSRSSQALMFIGPFLTLLSLVSFSMTLEKYLKKKKETFKKKQWKTLGLISHKLKSVKKEGTVKEIDIMPRIEINEIHGIVAIPGVTGNQVQWIWVLRDKEVTNENMYGVTDRNQDLYTTGQVLEMMKSRELEKERKRRIEQIVEERERKIQEIERDREKKILQIENERKKKIQDIENEMQGKILQIESLRQVSIRDKNKN